MSDKTFIEALQTTPIDHSKKIKYVRGPIDLSYMVDALLFITDTYVVGTYPKMESAEDLREAIDFRDWLIECNLIRY